MATHELPWFDSSCYLDKPPTLHVRRLHLGSPLEIVLLGGAGAPFLLKLLSTIRDWSADRRIMDARAQRAESEAQMLKSLADALSTTLAEDGIPEENVRRALQVDWYTLGQLELPGERLTEIEPAPEKGRC